MSMSESEKRELDEHGLEVIQRESFLETRNQDVIEHGHEPPHEKQNRHHCKRSPIGLAVHGRGRGS